MLPRCALTVVAAIGAVVVSNNEVRADPIHWSYASQQINGNAFVYAQHLTEGFRDYPQATSGPISASNVWFSQSEIGASNILLATLWPFDFDKPPKAGPVPIGTPYSPWSITVGLYDTASNNVGYFSFSGVLIGWISPTGYRVRNDFAGTTTEWNTIGKNSYRISIGPFVAPTGPVFTGTTPEPVGPPGTISAFVEVHPFVNTTPEPSCLALAGAGLGCLAVVGTLRRRRA
jgi:hypothetical protein